jgi:hypothetical protein
LSGIQTFWVASGTNSNTNRNVTVDCGGSTSRVLGGGALVTNGNSTVAITASYPASDTSWSASASEVDALAASWTLTAFVICV